MPIFDNHMHLRKDGDYLNAINIFKRYGGTHLNFCPYTDVEKIISSKSYMECYQDGIKLARHAMGKTGVTIFITIGPYPVDYIRIRKAIGRKEAIEVMKRGMEEAQKLCDDREAIAIGEIGRPHFEVSQDVLEDCNKVMEYGMVLAKESKIPVVLHMEKTTSSNLKEIAIMAKKIGLKNDKVIKHYSPPIIKTEENHGIFPSVIASENNIEIALKKGLRFMLETDYLDDLRRPGAVLALQTIPKKINKLIKQNRLGEEEAIVINKDNPEKIYEISLD